MSRWHLEWTCKVCDRNLDESGPGGRPVSDPRSEFTAIDNPPICDHADFPDEVWSYRMDLTNAGTSE